MEDTLSKVERWLSEAKPNFATLIKERQTYNDLVHRKLHPMLNPKLGAELDNYRTADLEDCEQDVIDILTMNPTRFGSTATEGDAHKDAKDAVLWSARTWNIENSARWIDRAIAAGQARYGFKAMRMLCRDLPEPSTADLKERRKELERRAHPWYFESVNDLSLSFIRRANQTEAVLYDYEIPYLSATDEYKVTGDSLGKDYKADLHYYPAITQGKLGWMADDVPVDSSLSGHKLHVTLCEYRDYDNTCPICPDAHPLWSGVEIIRDSSFKDGLIVQEYTLPYRHAGTIRIIAGRTMPLDSDDPHFLFRPLLFRLFVEATVMNWALATLHTLANRDSSTERVYMDLSSIPSEAIPRLPDEFWNNPTVKLPESGSGEVPLMQGKVSMWPVQASQMLLKVYDEARVRFEAAKPNRFLLGENYQEASQGTGTANVLSLQQARLPYGWPLTQTDDFILKCKEDQFHAIRLWDHEAPDKAETPYAATLTGAEHLIKGKAESNRKVYVTARKLSHDFELKLLTENETLQEQQLKRQMAIQGKQAGIITGEQVLDEWGYHDTETQMSLLREERVYEQNLPLKDQAQQNIMRMWYAEMADIDPALLATQPIMEPEPPVSAPGRPKLEGSEASVRLPATQGVSGGTSPTGGAF